MRRLAAAALLWTLGAAAAGAVTVEMGRAVYNQLCLHCHGRDMVNPGTASFDLRRFPRDDRARFFNSVTNGRGAMPAWGDLLRPGELDALWLYVATRGGRLPAPQMQEAPEPTEPESAEPAVASARETGARETGARETGARETGARETGAQETGAQETGARETGAPETGALTVCLDRHGGAMSGRLSAGGPDGGGRGLDYLLSAALADRLGLAFAPLWYEGAPDARSDPARETDALLALGLCDAVAGRALIAAPPGGAPPARARPPLWLNMPREWRLEQGETRLRPRPRRFVDLPAVTLTRPYARIEIGAVFAPGAPVRPIRAVADLAGLAVGVEQGALAGALTLLEGGAAVRARSRTFPPGPRFLWRLENGEAEAALVSVPAYDHHRIQNPLSRLALSDWRHPLGFNIGFAVPARERALAARLDAALGALLASGDVAAIAARAGVTYAPPRAPAVAPRPDLAALSAASRTLDNAPPPGR